MNSTRVNPILRSKEKLAEFIERSGGKTQARLALGVSSPCFGFWTLVHGLDEGNRVGKPKGWELLEELHRTGELRNMIDHLDMSVRQISREVGIKDRTIYAFLYRKGLRKLPGWQLEEWDKETVRQAVRRGRGNLAEICKILGASRDDLRQYLDAHEMWGTIDQGKKDSALVVQLAKRTESDSPLDDRALEVLLGLRQFLTLDEIGKIFGTTRERVRQVEEELLRRSSYAAIA
jgi:hypothetical protein